MCSERPEIPQRIIHVVRDGRAVVHSAMKKAYVIEEKNNDGKVKKKVIRQPRDRIETFFQALRGWLVGNLRTMQAFRTLPSNQYIRLRHEDLCIDPAGQLKRICSFIGVSYEQRMLNFRSITHHNIAGSAMRYRDESILPPDEEWRHGLKTSQLRFFQITAG